MIDDTRRTTLHGFITEHASEGANVMTDDFISYRRLDDYRHQFVRHSAGEYVEGETHINGVRSFWSMIKQAHKGTCHKMSRKHLNQYVDEFADRHNIREPDTSEQMASVVAGFIGRRLMNRELTGGADGRVH